MLSGIFLGVLLSRTVAGFVGAAFGWRAMFALAAIILFALVLTLGRVLPTTTPSYRGRYSGLLRSVWTLIREQPTLREGVSVRRHSVRCFHGVLVEPDPSYGRGAVRSWVPRAVGLYGILGAGAALLSPIVGRAADRGSARNVAGAMILLTIASFGVFWFWPYEPLLDRHRRACHGSRGAACPCQQPKPNLELLVADAQSRIQTAYMTSYFAGGGIGAAIGSWAWDRWGWAGTCSAAIAILAIPLVRWLLPLRAATAS